jgi:U1 zinc finger
VLAEVLAKMRAREITVILHEEAQRKIMRGTSANAEFDEITCLKSFPPTTMVRISLESIKLLTSLQSEYWVSHKKYYCKYCEIYIADDAPSRTQHETGLRHQGNKERFIRNLYKNGEKKKRDEEEEKRELARIDQASHKY